MTTDDMDLVRAYAAGHSESAFGTLVSRHANLVYSAALRQTRNPQLAEEVTQVVFIILARKAGSLGTRTILPGWLYRTACFAAGSALKGERRRQQREQEAYMQSTLQETGPAWEQMAPLLDEAMLRLGQTDRDALVLRYFEGRSLQEVGSALGANEGAAKKRVSRALEKLRKFFDKRGVSSTTAIIAGTISANSVHAAPVGLAAAITATAISAKITATVSAATKTMTTLQKIFTAATAATAVSVIIYAIHLQNQIQPLQQRQTSLLEQIQQLQQERDDATNRLAMLTDENKTLEANSIELLRLRAEVTRLRQRDNSIQATTNITQPMPILIHIKSRFLSIPDEDLQSMGIGWTAIPQGGQMSYLETSQLNPLLGAMAGVSNVTVLGMPEVQSINGQEVSMSVTKNFQLNDSTETNLGEIFIARPFYSTNSLTFDLSFDAELKQLTGDASQPMVQVVEITNQVTFTSGKTLVLEQSIPSGSWSPDATNMPTGPRDLLLFVTPEAVDSEGNLINQ